jgi:curli biogenesis system outer membrane secretion channel CsgG
MGSFRRSAVAVAGACAVIATSAVPVGAQLWEKLTNPKFTVPISHPPQVVFKAGTKIALRALEGPCANEIGDNLQQAVFQTRRFEVIERSQLESVLREQNFQASGSVAPETAAKIGALLGPSAMVMGRVNRCTVQLADPTYQNFTTTRNGQRITYRRYYRKATGYLTANIRIVDLSTGKLVASEQFEQQAARQTEADGDLPEPPDENLVRTDLYERLTADFMKLIAPWTEHVELTVYDDKKWNLKQSAEQIKRSDFEGAVATVRASIGQLEPAETDTKLIAHAYYNLGIGLLYSGQPAEALTALRKSDTLKGSDIAKSAIAVAQKSLALAERRARLEAQAIDLGPAPAPAAPAEEVLTNTDVIQMTKGKLGEPVILAKIGATKCKFDTSTKGLLELKAAGVSDTVIQAMTAAAARKGT